MARVFLVGIVLSILASAFVPGLYSSVLLLFRGNAPVKAVFVTRTTLSDWGEHRDMVADLFGGKLTQSPNTNAMHRSHTDPVSPTEEHKKGMVLLATSSREAGASSFSFQLLYLARDPGMAPTKYVFKNGRVANKTMLIIGYVDMAAERITYGYPASGAVRIRPAGPNSIEVETDVVFKCASGNGSPWRWTVESDCPQNLFPSSMVFEEAADGAL